MGLVYEEDLVNGYAVWATDMIEDAAVVRKDVEGSGATVVVSSRVVAYAWNDDFIVAKRHPMKGPQTLSGQTEWYVIEVAPGTVHGPLSTDEFRKLQAKLGIPAGLSWKKVH